MNPVSILIVDDEEALRKGAARFLRQKGYEVATASSGQEGWEALSQNPPHLVLLGLGLPDLDGRGLCAKIKSDPALQKVFVILISDALFAPEDQIAGFEAGADGCLSRPLQNDVLLAHIEALLRIRRRAIAHYGAMNEALEAQSELRGLQNRLREQNEELTATCDRLRELETLRDNLVHMVVHDLRSPLTAIIASLDFLRSNSESSLGKNEKICASSAFNGAMQLSEMINTLLDVSRLEAGRMPLERRPTDLAAIARNVAATLGPLIGERRLELPAMELPIRAYCDGALIRRVLTNLLDNAIRHTAEEGELRIEIRQAGGQALVSVSDNGPGIPPEFHQTIFQKFTQVGAKHPHTTGLGLTFCKLAVETHGGCIGVTSKPGHGCTIWFTLPQK